MKFRDLINFFLKIFFKVYRNKKLLLVFIFLLSFLVCLFFLFFLKNIGPEQHNVPGRDYLDYYAPIAERIMKGEGFPVKEKIGISNEHIGTFYPPGYPVILTILFSFSDLLNIERIKLIVIFNIFLTVIATCFLFFLVKCIFNKKIALISSLLWMSYPFNLWLIKNPNTEVPFIFFLFFAFWIYILGVKKSSFKFFFLAGFLLGLASLVRAISAFLIIPLAILLFFSVKNSLKKRAFLSLILLVAFILTVLPWILYVYFNIGEVIPIAEGGPRSVHYGLILMVDLPEEGKLILSDDVINLINRSRDKKIEDSVFNAVKFFSEELKNDPITVFKLVGTKIIRSWYATSVSWWEKEILLIQLLYLIPAIAGIVVWLKKLKEKRTYLIFLLTIVFYFWVLTIIAHSILRYMVPVMGIVMIFVSITFWYLLDNLIIKIRKKNEA